MRVYKGVVQKGSQKGRALGYPTVNIPLADASIDGVYAARVLVAGEAPYLAAAFADQARRVLEAHLLDFSDDLYGMPVTIELSEKLRDSHVYEDDARLRAAIAEDIAKVREYFKN